MAKKSKYFIYIPRSDSVMMDGKEPFVADEKEVRRVIEEETCNPKIYEAQPVSKLKAWIKRQEEADAKAASASYAFSPPSPEIRYCRPEGQGRFVLVVGDENVRKSGKMVKAFDSQEDAARLAGRSIKALTDEFPSLSYYILDTETYEYIDRISGDGAQRPSDPGPGVGQGERAGVRRRKVEQDRPA